MAKKSESNEAYGLYSPPPLPLAEPPGPSADTRLICKTILNCVTLWAHAMLTVKGGSKIDFERLAELFRKETDV